MMAAAQTNAERVADEVRALEALGVEALREAWRRRFSTSPPALRAGDMMRRCLAEAIQIDAFGRDAELERRLATLVRGHDRGETPKAPGPIFRPGTVLTRDHGGRTHRVEVLEEGFLWEGQTFKSLSEIARAITGVRWNGPRFFGLREAKADAGRGR
jgi:hypothetical protein